MKIETMKEMTLHELIQWGWENRVKGTAFLSKNGKRVRFNSNGLVIINSFCRPSDTFLVRTVEEVTEETIIPKLIEVYEEEYFILHRNLSVKSIVETTTTAIYILNDDRTMQLIWKDGEFVG